MQRQSLYEINNLGPKGDRTKVNRQRITKDLRARGTNENNSHMKENSAKF